MQYLREWRWESARSTANPTYRLEECLRTQLEGDAERLSNRHDMHYVDGDLTPKVRKAIADAAIDLILENAKKKLCVQLTEEMEKQGISAIWKLADEAIQDYCTRQEV
jgi:hypothetical protein